MSTHPITPGTKIPLPCWLLYGNEWSYFVRGRKPINGATHYSTLPESQRPEGVPQVERGAPFDEQLSQTSDPAGVAQSDSAHGLPKSCLNEGSSAVTHTSKLIDFNPERDGALRPGLYEGPTVKFEVPAPHPTLAQLVEGAARELSDLYNINASLFESALLRHLSPEWERMERERDDATIGRCKCSGCGRTVNNAWRDTEGHHCLTCLAKDLAALRTEKERLTRERDDAEERLQPLVELVERHTVESDESFETDDVLESHYKELKSLRTRLRELEEEEDKELWEWAATHPEDTFGAFCSWWATAGRGGREMRFEFRNIVKMGRDSARKEAP